jgi:hypothetical protein
LLPFFRRSSALPADLRPSPTKLPCQPLLQPLSSSNSHLLPLPCLQPTGIQSHPHPPPHDTQLHPPQPNSVSYHPHHPPRHQESSIFRLPELNLWENVLQAPLLLPRAGWWRPAARRRGAGTRRWRPASSSSSPPARGSSPRCSRPPSPPAQAAWASGGPKSRWPCRRGAPSGHLTSGSHAPLTFGSRGQVVAATRLVGGGCGGPQRILVPIPTFPPMIPVGGGRSPRAASRAAATIYGEEGEGICFFIRPTTTMCGRTRCIMWARRVWGG